MMGRLKSEQGQLFYEFHLGDAVPEDHLVRKIDTALDLSWLRGELAPHYSSMGRPSVDPELMIRMLVVGYVFAIRSERLICREVQVNLAYRWFCKLGIEDASNKRSDRQKRCFERIYFGGRCPRFAESAMPAKCRHLCAHSLRAPFRTPVSHVAFETPPPQHWASVGKCLPV
jgi:Transposase domain (DUF772)